MELDKVSDEEVIIAVDKLNSRPRKCLGYKTPYEAFKELTGIDARKSQVMHLLLECKWFKTYKCAEIALYHVLGKLPEPEMTHRFY